MDSRLYAANLSYAMREDELQKHFCAFGSVSSAKVMTERDTGCSKGFGFFEMGSAEEAKAAIDGLHGKPIDGRAVTVDLAPRTSASNCACPTGPWT
ncbi:RNA-binding protein [uncultured Variovorax sp.]|uniref:RNA recognition motif domain-containing protein n=1 Tax=uncultured Variovorax sp. TaxID=114708 RepID=UPI0025FEEE16|nr:RNA-binding protein [uncultured Variovorax sp.]